VGPIRFAQSELLGLSPDRLALLEDIVTLGVVIQRDDGAELVHPVVEAWTGERLLPELFRTEQLLADAGVTDENLEALYATAPEYELTVRHLIVLSERYETDETRAAARAKAERALERIRAGEPFPEVAAEVSEEPGAEGRQGLLNPGRQGAWVDEFWSAASALEVGQISPVVETQYGFHVLRLEGRDVVPFDEVRASVAARAAGMLPGAGSVELPSTPPEEMAGGFVVSAGETLVADDAVAVRWDGGAISLGEVRDGIAGLAAAELARETPAGSVDEVPSDAQIRTVARWALRAAQAERRGLSLDPGRLSAYRTEWTDRVQAWGRQMGFTPGMSEEALKETALGGLSATGQLFQVTRGELSRARPLLARYLARMDSGD
jgi:hypothetical protein